MDYWQAILLGLLQGITEFVPVSSSGHLALGQHVLGVQQAGLTFEIFVHFGTALSIVVVYRQRLLHIMTDLWRAIRVPGILKLAFRPGSIERPAADGPLETGPVQPPTDPPTVASARLAIYILLTMIPTALAYAFLRDPLEGAFENTVLVSSMLLVTGTILLLSQIRKRPDGHLSPLKALLVGVGQSMALLPGISRSGTTISTAIYMNVDRQQAADFSFLMLLPVLFGATIIDVVRIFATGAGEAVAWGPTLAATLVAFVSGIYAIRLVVVFVRERKLVYFAAYCYIIGIAGLLFL